MKKLSWLIIPLLVLGIFMGGKYFYFKPKYINGEKASDFTAQLISGESFKLSDMNGKYVVLDFWGSWCGPCRQENPSIVALYHEYKDKKFKDASGFDIISVAIETNERSWKAAIQKDGLVWPTHIAEMQRFKSPIVMQYGVREIPTKYLLNPKGQIISVNPSAHELDQLLKNRLES